MNYATIHHADIANGVGCRTSLFVSGCTHHCKDCFNEIAWDFDYGKPFDQEVEDRIVDSLKASYMDGLTVLGGEPMELQNQPAVRHLLERVRAEVPGKTVWIYSGYTWEELTDETNTRCHSGDTLPILQMTDILVDGEFVADLKNISLPFRGSSNQRIIDVQKTLETKEIVLTKYMQERVL